LLPYLTPQEIAEVDQFYQDFPAQINVALFGTSAPYTNATGDYHAKQHEFVTSEATLTAFIGGVNSGKTYAGCIRAFRAAYGLVGNNPIPVPNKGMITAPTYKVLRDPVVETFKNLFSDFIVGENENAGILRMDNGSEILCRSCEKPELLRGPNLTWWFGDEAALYRSMVYKVMIGRLREGGQLGYGWIGTTPKGRNWVWQVFKTNSDSHRMLKSVSRENVFMDGAYFDLLETEYTGDFKAQELEAKFVAYQGLVYPEFEYSTHVTGVPKTHNLVTAYAGVDWGFANPGCILVGQVDNDGQVVIVAEHYARGLRVDEWVAIAEQMRREWRIETFYCDPSEPKNIQQFREAGLAAVKAQTDVMAGIQQVKHDLAISPFTGRPRCLFTTGCPNTFAEFEMYCWTEHGEYGIQDKPVKANDHAMDALKYLLNSMPREGQVQRASVRVVRTI